MLFDDLNWSWAEGERRYGRELPEWLARYTREERQTQQVRKIWELLVKRHPAYGEFHEHGQWGLARKLAVE